VLVRQSLPLEPYIQPLLLQLFFHLGSCWFSLGLSLDRNLPAYFPQVAGITGMHHHIWIVF
jgi:hypothetical protein